MKQLLTGALAFVLAFGLSVTLTADLEQNDRSATSTDTTTELSVVAGEKCDKEKKEKCDKKKDCDKKKECDKKEKDGDKS